MNNEEISEINQATRKIIAAAKPRLDSKVIAELEEYARVGEPALAVEGLIYCVEREGLSLSDSLRASLYSLAMRMGIDLEKIRSDWPRA